MIAYTTYLKDIAGNNYLGIKVYQDLVYPYLTKLKKVLGDDYDSYINNQINRDHGSHHITVINVMEFNSLSKKTTEFINSLDKIFDYMIDDIQLLGIGTASRNNNTTYYIVCRSEKLQSIRKRYNLPEQDFHITLGFKHKDVFGVRKNVVMDEKSEFINVLTQEYMNKENFNFIKNIDNYEEDTNLDILPVSINDTFLKIKVGDYLLDVGLLDPQNKLWIFTKYKDSAGVSTMSTTEILRILKK